MENKGVKTVSLKTFIIVIIIIILICAGIVAWILLKSKPADNANSAQNNTAKNNIVRAPDTNSVNEPTYENILLQEYALTDTVGYETIADGLGGRKDYYYLKDTYKGEYDIQYLSFTSIPTMGVNRVLTYDEYTTYCKTWYLNQKYKDTTKKYAVYAHVCNGSVTAILGGVELVSDTVKLYVKDDIISDSEEIAAYVLIVPTTETGVNVEAIPLYTEEEIKFLKEGEGNTTNENTVAENTVVENTVVENTTNENVAYPEIDYNCTEDKPIIYLYPKKETEISVKLLKSENLTCSYPIYKNMWKVLAKPNGDLKDLDTGKKLYSLYYECKAEKGYKVEKEGFVVKGEDSAKFLEEALKILGLNYKEAEEFIVYWIPKLEANKYNYIRFAEEDEINKNMPLEVSPSPDTTIRVMMTYKGLDKPISVKKQKLTKKERKGYTLVEWGGSEIK